MTSNCDVTNSAHQMHMTTICHWTKPHTHFLRAALVTGEKIDGTLTKRIWQHYAYKIHDILCSKFADLHAIEANLKSCYFHGNVVTFMVIRFLSGRGLKLKLLRGPNKNLQNNPRAALWRWRNIGGTWTLTERAFASYFLQKVSWITGISFRATSTFV